MNLFETDYLLLRLKFKQERRRVAWNFVGGIVILPIALSGREGESSTVLRDELRRIRYWSEGSRYSWGILFEGSAVGGS